MTNSILQDFYTGKLVPCKQKNVQDPEFKEMIKKADKEERYLTGRLSPDDCQHFQEFKKLMHQSKSLNEVEIFKTGYRLGVLMMIEVFESKGGSADE